MVNNLSSPNNVIKELKSKMRKITNFSLLLLSVFLICSLNAIGQNRGDSNRDGEQLLLKLAQNTLNSKEISFNARVTFNGETTLNNGLFFATSERGYLFLKGEYEYEYDNEKVQLLNLNSNELTIQKRKSSSNIAENPFVILQQSDNQSISSPKLEILSGKKVKSITIVSSQKRVFKSAKIYMTTSSNPELIQIDIEGDRGFKYEVKVTKISSISSSEESKYKIDANRKGLKINDLR